MKRDLLAAAILLLGFFLLVLLLLVVDVRPIGPHGSSVGLAGLNGAVHRAIGVHPIWYSVTDWLGLTAFLPALVFAGIGFSQLLRTRSLHGVDSSLLVLGASYLVVLLLYVFFELVVVNHRPILIDGNLEASFPSSHTMAVVSVMGTACVQLRRYVANTLVGRCLQGTAMLVVAITVLGRLYSGVHWFTDIVGGVLLGSAIVLVFRGATSGEGQ